MAKNLLIVESPAKAKTIEKFLGKDFKVKSSFGHIRDLDKGNQAIDIEKGFIPKYIVPPEKSKTVKDLKEAAKSVDEVWLATDEDREGEAISWHLCEVLDLNPTTTKRIVFREITKPAIQKAIQAPRTVDINLVNAQQARRVLDRLVGFELSETLWRKVKGKLSAGRVQSVAVRLVADREREINAFVPEAFFKVQAIFTVVSNGKTFEFKAELDDKLSDEPTAKNWIDACVNADFSVDNVDVKPATRKPAPPFTTSTLQQEASRKLGFSVKRTMSAAQKLYEQGWISYMRTDSVNLSETAQQAILQQIKKEFGDAYMQPRQYSNKNTSAQEAHEAIRPSYAERSSIDEEGDRDMQRLYELIWKRALASQMSDAKLERTIVDIAISAHPKDHLVAKGEVIKFDGFLKLYMENQDDDQEDEENAILPPLSKGQALSLKEMTGTERYSKPPARYTEAGLVKKLEELGIGRPSTYAPIISKIMEDDRGYVIKENRPGVERKYQQITLRDKKVAVETKTEITGAISNRLVPTDMGLLVTDFLNENFPSIMDYNFTADIEKQFDVIAEGDLLWNKMIGEFYGPFHEKVEETLENAGRVRGRRDLGTDPESGLTLLTQMTRFGPVVQIGTKEELGDDGKPRFANLKPGQSIETITAEEALELFKLPRYLDNYKGQGVMIGAGRFGPYVKHGETFISLPKDEDPLTISQERAQELIDAKLKEDAPITTYKGKPVSKGKGRFGPFLKYEGIFINIPKKIDPDHITQEEAHKLIEAKLEKEANRFVQQWEKEKLAIENGRWGPFIRQGKKSISLPKLDGKKFTSETAALLTLEEVKAIINGEFPDSAKAKLEQGS